MARLILTKEEITYPCRRRYRKIGAVVEFTSYDSLARVIEMGEENIDKYPIGSYQAWSSPDHQAYEVVPISKKARLLNELSKMV